MTEAEGCIASRLEEDVEFLDEEAVVRVAVPLGESRSQVCLEVAQLAIVHSKNSATVDSQKVVTGDCSASERRQEVQDVEHVEERLLLETACLWRLALSRVSSDTFFLEA